MANRVRNVLKFNTQAQVEKINNLLEDVENPLLELLVPQPLLLNKLSDKNSIAEWRQREWGTKWEIIDAIKPNEKQILTETAWDTYSDKVLEELAKIVGDFTLSYSDEFDAVYGVEYRKTIRDGKVTLYAKEIDYTV